MSKIDGLKKKFDKGHFDWREISELNEIIHGKDCGYFFFRICDYAMLFVKKGTGFNRKSYVGIDFLICYYPEFLIKQWLYKDWMYISTDLNVTCGEYLTKEIRDGNSVFYKLKLGELCIYN